MGEWYDLCRIKHHGGIGSAAMIYCLLCKEAVSGMGGPAEAICVKCGDAIKSGEYKLEVQFDALTASNEALREAGKAVLYHDERGQGVGYAEAMDKLKAALAEGETNT